MMPLLYYIRHGETDWNTQGRLQGQRDLPINAHGHAQACQCADILRDLIAREDDRQPDFVSSPLGRARETMEIVRAALGLDPAAYRIDECLIEISFGGWKGSRSTNWAAARPMRSRRASATNGASRRPAPRATRATRHLLGRRSTATRYRPGRGLPDPRANAARYG